MPTRLTVYVTKQNVVPVFYILSLSEAAGLPVSTHDCFACLYLCKDK